MSQENTPKVELYINGRRIANVRELVIDIEHEQEMAAADIRAFLMDQIAKGTPVYE